MADNETAQLRAELQRWQEKYERLEQETTVKIDKLIEENEILAEANRLLMEQQASFAADRTPLQVVPDELLLPGNGLVTSQLSLIEQAHSFGNLLSVSIQATAPYLVLTGGVDKHIVLHDWRNKRKLAKLEVSSPVLQICCNPSREHADLFLAALMDAKHVLGRVVQDPNDPETWRMEMVQEFHDHSRPGTMRVAWDSTGTLFGAGSSDKSLTMYRCSDLSAVTPQVEKIKSFFFNGTVEAMVFAPFGATGEENLVVAVRDDCYVHYINCATLEKQRINMNQDGIEHVSYNIMDLRLSPTGKFLLAATDCDRHFIFQPKSNFVLRNFYGHKAGPYSQPRAIWHPSEKYVISNTEDSGKLFVWCIASEKVIETVAAHEALVRDLVYSKSDDCNAFVTVSYDKNVQVWKGQAS